MVVYRFFIFVFFTIDTICTLRFISFTTPALLQFTSQNWPLFVISYLRQSFQNLNVFVKMLFNCQSVSLYYCSITFCFNKIHNRLHLLVFWCTKISRPKHTTYMHICLKIAQQRSYIKLIFFSLTSQSMTFCAFHPSAICIFVPKKLIQLIG